MNRRVFRSVVYGLPPWLFIYAIYAAYCARTPEANHVAAFLLGMSLPPTISLIALLIMGDEQDQ